MGNMASEFVKHETEANCCSPSSARRDRGAGAEHPQIIIIKLCARTNSYALDVPATRHYYRPRIEIRRSAERESGAAVPFSQP